MIDTFFIVGSLLLLTLIVSGRYWWIISRVDRADRYLTHDEIGRKVSERVSAVSNFTLDQLKQLSIELQSKMEGVRKEFEQTSSGLPSLKDLFLSEDWRTTYSIARRVHVRASNHYVELREFVSSINQMIMERDSAWKTPANHNEDTNTRGRKVGSVNYSAEYAGAIKALNVTQPTFKMLEEHTGRSASTWNRLFADLAFVAALKKELHKRQSRKYSRTPESVDFWRRAEKHVDSIIDEKFARSARSKEVRYDDGRKMPRAPNSPQTDDPEIDDVIDEDTARNFGIKQGPGSQEYEQ